MQPGTVDKGQFTTLAGLSALYVGFGMTMGVIQGGFPTVMRAAKASLNGIDLWDVHKSYRFEQGFTFELNLAGVADEHRDAFVAKRDTDVSR